MHTPLLALLLTVLAGFAPPQAPRPAALPTEVEQRYAALQNEFSAAVAEYQKALAAARAAESAEKPARPHRNFAARYVELARAGHPRAARWCLDFVADTSDDVAARRALFVECEAQLVPHVLWLESTFASGAPRAGEYGPKELLRAISASAALLGREQALALCDGLFAKLALPESKAQALGAQAAIELGGKQPDADMPAAARAVYERLAKEFAGTDSGKRASGLLFRIDNLSLGKTAPDFETQDVEGVAFKLGDYRGKVVVLDFWGFW